MLTYEADQRHADLLMAAYGLNVSSKGKAIPWDKANFLARQPLAGPFLDEKRRVEFRSNCMRCLYLALDRPDIQFTAKEISRAMTSPTVHADETLKATSRYLVSHPRVLGRYPRQEWTGKVLGLTDSNWAACPVSRKITLATYLMLEKHPIFAASPTKTILSLSSGEAEFYGAVRCACRTLGLKSLMSDLSLDVKAELVTDSSGCKGLCSRRGAGRIRHIHCPALCSNTPWHDDRLRSPGVQKGLGSRCRDQGGHPRRHHVATAGNVWTGQGRRSSEASFEHGKSASEGLSTWLRHVCTTNFERCSPSHAFSTKLYSDCVGCHFVIIAVLRQRSACKAANATFQLLEPVLSHMCVLPAIRAFSFFFLGVVWNGRKPALL